MFSGKRPDNLGVKDGRLATCGRPPERVFGPPDPAGPQRYVAPIPFKADAQAALSAARKAVERMRRATVIRQEGNYLHAEFRSKLMGFVDDVELMFDESSGVRHVRSPSRLGRRDFNVNRERVEALRARLE